MQTDLGDPGQFLMEGDKARLLSEKESHSDQTCTVSIGSEPDLQQGSVPERLVTEVSEVPSLVCAGGSGTLLGASFIFAPLEDSWADLLRETGVNFTQEDLDCLRDFINTSFFMRYYYLFSVSGLSCFLKITTLVLGCVACFYSTEMFELYVFFFSYLGVFIIFLFPFAMCNNVMLNFNTASFRQTNTVVSLSPGFLLSKPSVTLTAYQLEPCKEVISSLFKARYFQQPQHSELDEKKWDRAVDQFVCSCVSNIFQIRRLFAKSKKRVHTCSKGEKCICELIMETADLSAFPPQVSPWNLKRAYSAFGFYAEVFKRKIVFRYSVTSEGLETKT